VRYSQACGLAPVREPKARHRFGLVWRMYSCRMSDRSACLATAAAAKGGSLSTRSLIFDIGCHNGRDSEFYLKKGFTVVAVEANPSLCLQLKQRFADQIASGQFLLVEKAIAEQRGEVEFYLSEKDSIWGTIRPEHAAKVAGHGAASTKIIVPSIPFSELIECFGVPHYMKVDIEGADLLCVEGLARFPQRPRFISIERSLSFGRQIMELRLLSKLGYTRFQVIDQQTIPTQKPPNPAREGQYADHRFELHDSGLFGEELPHAWLTVRGAVLRNAELFARNKRIGLLRRLPLLSRYAGGGSWYDLHAALPARQ
jgi:FkbM family methyltransferase